MKHILFFIAIILSGCTKAQIVGVWGKLSATSPKTFVSNPLTNAVIVGDGNSYVQGNGYTSFVTVISTTSPFNSNSITFYNFGVGAQTTPNMIADQATQVLPVYVSGVQNILLVCEGGNDIYFNGSVANAVANMRTYCNTARAAGFKVILTTTIRRDQTTTFGDNPTQYNAKLAQFNDSLIADNSFYDALIRPDTDPLFLTYTSGGYDADKVHPNQTGQNRFAALFINAIYEILN